MATKERRQRSFRKNTDALLSIVPEAVLESKEEDALGVTGEEIGIKKMIEIKKAEDRGAAARWWGNSITGGEDLEEAESPVRYCFTASASVFTKPLTFATRPGLLPCAAISFTMALPTTMASALAATIRA
jgi:hypothetical protein